MSLLKTLAKVAIGVAVAKGVSTMARNSQARTPSAGRTPGGGLEDMMGEILGSRRSGSAPGGTAGGMGGSMGDLLNELGSATRPASASRRSQTPDLGTILGQLGGGGSRSGGGLGDLLGQLAGAGAAGGLGGLLGGMLSGRSGNLGGMLDEALRTGQEPATPPAPEQELAAAILLKAMIQAAKADGMVDAAEQERLMARLGDISAEDRAFVERELAAPVDPEALAGLVPEGLEAQAYSMSVMAIDLDTQPEGAYLDRLARALGLPPDEINRIHDQIGAPRLYA